ncbi:HTH-type transcriptional regulator Hpr [Bacillus sp. GM2]|jgi:MarR family protease production transcriptional regulator HPr|uniref:HTH-type transcriptional regulator Hpr n=2 Tax=Bacillus licheniformis TaxID=1402 RepID=HPR_BACLD|nr:MULTISPECIES: HTH-type transcriptional regulator Hpr [Bacillus]Q65LS8.1 RecName: Full=HTH-type transcriptional regulator Hpr; AltName: Full=Protease production regulatory protein Hpr [Bacillus licheniformis DSM 13 = ATCC 14580]MBJ7886758.1 HTH-type transcriptional regulator Hpr [Bacillaceae bacterium HSR45]MBY8349583.1 HTH-type transcriptional regulator Hpr [Bacillus sp. PCH94]MDP4081423.1 HTH-type transcriptional regulator Hpr [Bacillota bacterium]AAU22639.1 transcriptional regulator Hpr [
MNRAEEPYTVKEALLFSQRMAQLSKALWKSIEKDWQQWIKPYDLNINEHHILWIAYQLNGASISEIAKFGVMHVSTAFNFSKKLEERGYLEFSKKLNDKRNTYIQLTPKGEEVFLKILESYDPTRNAVLKGAQPLHQLYGKFPEIVEMMSIIRHIYGDDFMEIFEKSFSNIENEFTSEEGKMKKKQEAKEAGESIEVDKPLEPLKN